MGTPNSMRITDPYFSLQEASPETQIAQRQTPLKKICIKHKMEARKQKGKGGKVHSLSTPYFIFILIKICILMF
jgi:hypothetical protein